MINKNSSNPRQTTVLCIWYKVVNVLSTFSEVNIFQDVWWLRFYISFRALKYLKNCLMNLMDACALKIRLGGNYHNYAMKTDKITIPNKW